MVCFGFGGRVSPDALKERAQALNVHVDAAWDHAVESSSDGPEERRGAISAHDGVGSSRH